MLNRQIKPETKITEHIDFINPQAKSIKEGIQTFYFNNVNDNTVRIELHFNAGQIFGKRNIAMFTNSLLLSGTKTKNSQQIQAELDLLGAYVEHEITIEGAFVNLFCLKTNVKHAFELLIEAITEVVFDKQELEDAISEKKQQYLVSNEKVNYLARKAFQECFFESDDRYNATLNLNDFNNVDRTAIVEFHKNNYLKGLKKFVVVGNLEDEVYEHLCLKTKIFSNEVNLDFITQTINKKGLIQVEKPQAIQTAIRIGWPMFNKKNKDYFHFQILQTILGDYFGSRLMSNIREDKGYTYGIGCTLLELKEFGYFIIATEVGKDVADATLKEIKFEVERLQSELVPEEELALVKNYLLGQILKSADGPNAVMDLFLSVYQHQMDLDFYNEFIKAIIDVKAEDLLIVAKKYLNWEEATIISAGKHN